jgi:hypothetical protein
LASILTMPLARRIVGLQRRRQALVDQAGQRGMVAIIAQHARLLAEALAGQAGHRRHPALLGNTRATGRACGQQQRQHTICAGATHTIIH